MNSQMKIQVRAYMAEAKWFHQGHVPTMEEYMPIALTTIGCELTFVTAFLGTGDVVTKDDFDWLLFSDPKIVKASQVICRLMNDIAGHKVYKSYTSEHNFIKILSHRFYQ